MQRALRRWLPYVYFSDTARYKDLGAALPLLAWSHSLPCTGFSRYELTYDSMNQKHVQLLLASAQRGLAAQLPQIGSLLQRKGLNSTAKYYLGVSSRQVVAEQIRSPRLVKSLMYSDASLVDSIVDLLEKGHHLNQLLTSDPQAAVRSLNKFSAEFTKTFHTKLKRLYGGRQFLAFSTLLLAEATSALNEALGQPAPLMASLELTPAGKTNAPAQIFLNPAFRT